MNGSSQQDYRPLSWAAATNNVGMIKFLVGKGADLEAKTGALPSTEELTPSFFRKNRVDRSNDTAGSPNGKREITTTVAKQGYTKGMMAVHVAAYYGQVAALRALLQAGADPNALADPNAIDSEGRTPLSVACSCNLLETPSSGVAMVHELLEAGADSCVAINDTTPLDLAAKNGDTGLIDLLLAKAPETLYHGCEEGGLTALSFAIRGGHESAVLHLLSAGSNESEARLAKKSGLEPLTTAIMYEHKRIARALVEKGLWAIGGAATAIPAALPMAISTSVRSGDTSYVRLLLEAEGSERVEHWARCSALKRPVLHHAAWIVAIAAVNMLLQAGADETAVGSCGRTAIECLPGGPGAVGPCSLDTQRDPEEVAAVRRMLGRGPAYRARSWGWLAEHPTTTVASADPAAGAAGMAPSLSSRPTAPVGVRIFRPESTKFYVRLIAR